jgi:ribosome-binding factor A
MRTGQVRVRAQQGSILLKNHNRRRRESSPFVNPDFAEALGGGGSARMSKSQGQRKAQQFCRQVQRALNLALADRYEDDGLNELFVDDVTPAPDCGHLLVHVVVPANRSVTDALSSLRRDASRLRSEVAMTISRKRAPELSFVPMAPGGGEDD